MQDAIDGLTLEIQGAEADLAKIRVDAKNGATLNAVMEQTALIPDVKANTDLLPDVAKNLAFIRDVMCGKAPGDPNASWDDGVRQIRHQKCLQTSQREILVQAKKRGECGTVGEAMERHAVQPAEEGALRNRIQESKDKIRTENKNLQHKRE